jgi:hypothetical protein
MDQVMAAEVVGVVAAGVSPLVVIVGLLGMVEQLAVAVAVLSMLIILKLMPASLVTVGQDTSLLYIRINHAHTIRIFWTGICNPK